MSTINIEGIEAAPGERAFGYVESSKTASQIPIHIPVNVCNGAKDGPTLMVNAALHGDEIIGTLGLGKVLRELDESELSGCLVAVPVTNTSAFEFGARNTYWDNQNPTRNQSGADPEGSPTQQLQHMYYNVLVPQMDAVVDIHSSGPDGFVRYTAYAGNFSSPEVKEKTRKMALAFGVRQVWSATPERWGDDLETDTPQMLVEFGGGTDFLKNGQKQIDKCAQGIINVMRCMGMLEGEIEHETDKVQICKGYDAEVWSGTHAGIALRDCDFEDYLEEGDPFASFYNPFTGEKVGEVKAPRSGIVLNTGLQWPKVDQNQWLGVLGEVVDEVSLDDEDLMWD